METEADRGRASARVELVAHRGYAARYPENTLLSLSRAVEAGARFLEFDVHLTADRVPVLLHDRDLRRTAGRPELISDLPSSVVPSVSVHEPDRLGERFAGEPIPTLAEVVDWLQPQVGVHSFVELKRKALARWGAETMVPIVLAALAPILERTTLISFDAPSIALARRQGALSIGWVLSDWSGVTAERARALAPEFLFVDYERIPAAAPLWPGRWRWAVYEVTDPVRARALAARGADLVETMAIGEMHAALESADLPRGAR